MARHTKIYNALISFYRESIDELIEDISTSKKTLQSNPENYEALRSTLVSEIEAVVDLARDQAIHFHENAKLIKQWEKEDLVETTAVYADRSLRRLRTSRVVGSFTSIDISGLDSDVSKEASSQNP